MTYREMYDEVFDRSKAPTSRFEKVKGLAQLIFSDRKNESGYTKEDAVWEALERYEDMSGNYFDPTHEQFEAIKYALV